MICLKNRTFAVSQTTVLCLRLVYYWLWFAWKIVLLQYRKQLQPRQLTRIWRCDLLEKSYFCSIANNGCATSAAGVGVVICLKNRTFAVSQTTLCGFDFASLLLWFAWKIVLLQYRKQLMPLTIIQPCRCDLLEKSYFCSIANNLLPIFFTRCRLWFAWKIVLLQYRKQQIEVVKSLLPVVICLKNRTFAVSQTTSHPPAYHFV